MDMKLVTKIYLITAISLWSFTLIVNAQSVPRDFIDPPREFSVMPFWFWNDTLKDEEIVRQIADFEEHGVYGFVIHPRIGLPENIKWLSEEMIHFMTVAIEEASRRNMSVILYDEGMYPSGSSSGQVVARNPKHAARGLVRIDLKQGESPLIAEDEKLITILDRPGGQRIAIVERPSKGKIRGLHYIGEGTDHLQEESPPAGDILNPEAVSSFIELVHDRYFKEFGKYFGTTVLGIFTDEPSPLGRGSTDGMVQGNSSLLPQIKKTLGYDITPYLADLWYNDNPDSPKHRSDYNKAVNICLEENYYKRLSEWCRDHKISLMGHPAGSMDIGSEKYFQIPGQDLVWRYVEPGYKSLEGQHSTMAKCASSAMLHQGSSRNSNELYGAYGHTLTYEEMMWLADWCFVRGQNFLIPHAFFYSIRGPRFDERPPDVGPNAAWWNIYKEYADGCRRLSWLNTGSKQVCEVAILCEDTFLPDKAAKICYEQQVDFNYLETRYLYEDAIIDTLGIHIAGMNYGILIIDSLSEIPVKANPALKKLAANGRLIINKYSQYASLFEWSVTYHTSESLTDAIHRKILPDISLSTPSVDIRYRHILKGNDHFYIIFNEGANKVSTRLNISDTGSWQLLNPQTAKAVKVKPDENISIKPHELLILRITN
jgi:hypothetical protein